MPWKLWRVNALPWLINFIGFIGGDLAPAGISINLKFLQGL
jgi:hypothetical protein